jgi:hypothetical protein
VELNALRNNRAKKEKKLSKSPHTPVSKLMEYPLLNMWSKKRNVPESTLVEET